MLNNLVLRVDGRSEGERVDRFLRKSLPAVPSRSVRLALDSSEVLKDGRPCRKGDPVTEGQTILVKRLAEEDDWLPVPGDLPAVRIVYRDASVVVLEKPAGIQTEPLRPGETGTLAGCLRWHFPEAYSRALGNRPLLSRLDRDTSGLVLAALTPESRLDLERQRGSGLISKRYVCRVNGRVEGARVLDGAIESRGGDRVRVVKGRRESDPSYWTRIDPISIEESTTLLCAEILKGKRHQIRAHLSAAGYPIVGDRLYGKGEAGRLMLHAAEVAFRHPSEGKAMRVSSPLPEGFERQRAP